MIRDGAGIVRRTVTTARNFTACYISFSACYISNDQPAVKRARSVLAAGSDVASRLHAALGWKSITARLRCAYRVPANEWQWSPEHDAAICRHVLPGAVRRLPSRGLRPLRIPAAYSGWKSRPAGQATARVVSRALCRAFDIFLKIISSSPVQQAASRTSSRGPTLGGIHVEDAIHDAAGNHGICRLDCYPNGRPFVFALRAQLTGKPAGQNDQG